MFSVKFRPDESNTLTIGYRYFAGYNSDINISFCRLELRRPMEPHGRLPRNPPHNPSAIQCPARHLPKRVSGGGPLPRLEILANAFEGQCPQGSPARPQAGDAPTKGLVGSTMCHSNAAEICSEDLELFSGELRH